MKSRMNFAVLLFKNVNVLASQFLLECIPLGDCKRGRKMPTIDYQENLNSYPHVLPDKGASA